VGISLKPSNYEEGGALLDNADVEVTDARFILGDYDGKSAVTIPLCKVVMAVGEGDGVHFTFPARFIELTNPRTTDIFPILSAVDARKRLKFQRSPCGEAIFFPLSLCHASASCRTSL